MHVIALASLYGQALPKDDLVAVAIDSAIAFGPVAALAIVPLLEALRGLVGARFGGLPLALAGAGWFPVMTAIVFLRFGGLGEFRWEDLLGHEARLFHVQFAASGLFLGWGVASRESADEGGNA